MHDLAIIIAIVFGCPITAGLVAALVGAFIGYRHLKREEKGK